MKPFPSRQGRVLGNRKLFASVFFKKAQKVLREISGEIPRKTFTFGTNHA